MRHRASRPLADFLHRLPRAAAHQLEKAARWVPVRGLVALMVAASLGIGGYAVLAPMVGGSSSGGTERAIDTSSPDADRPDLTTQTPSKDSRTPDGSTPKQPDTGAAGQPQAPEPPATRDVTTPSPTELDSTTGSPSTETPPPTSTSPSPTDEASSRKPADTTPPNTSLSEEFPERDSAVFTLSANEEASFTCSLDGAAFTACDSPTSYSDLESGWHTFAVRATDNAGNVDPSPAETRWHAKGGQTEDE